MWLACRVLLESPIDPCVERALRWNPRPHILAARVDRTIGLGKVRGSALVRIQTRSGAAFFDK